MSFDGVSDHDRALLQFLLQDLRDAEIAAALFVSLRTLHRRLDRLMTLAGAGSRFTLGVRALQLGWITPAVITRLEDAA